MNKRNLLYLPLLYFGTKIFIPLMELYQGLAKLINSVADNNMSSYDMLKINTLVLMLAFLLFLVWILVWGYNRIWDKTVKYIETGKIL